jgi:hypothetical protein
MSAFDFTVADESASHVLSASWILGMAAEHPWPRGLSPVDDDGLRVSSALAQRDALALLPDPTPAFARRSLARAMHGLVLRHGFKTAEVERLAGPWAALVIPPAPAPQAARRR